MKCQYLINQKKCHGEIGTLYQNPPDSQRWWGKCVVCGRSNRISITTSSDNTKFAHAATSGPKSQELVQLGGVRIRKDQQEKLLNCPNKSEIIRNALDLYLDL